MERRVSTRCRFQSGTNAKRPLRSRDMSESERREVFSVPPAALRTVQRRQEPFGRRRLLPMEVQPMSKETPKSDPRQRSDWGSHKQTDKPWKGNPEKEQRNEDVKPDLEKWQESDTH
jgi:hypothetical protein